MTLPLFDVRPIALAREAEPERRPYLHSGTCADGFSPCGERYGCGPDDTRSDVLRVITLKCGDFTAVKEGRSTGRTFRLWQMRDGSFKRKWNDGTLDDAPPAVTDFYINEGLHFGTFVEVQL